MTRSTWVVEGPLAFRTGRERAAGEGRLGVEILTLPMLAARLAGGFVRPAAPEDLQGAVRIALAEAEFAEIGRLASLPGMTRAAIQTLNRLWRADVALSAQVDLPPRLADIARLEALVRAALPKGALIPPDLRDAALARIAYERTLLGEVRLEGVPDVAPVWRPLLAGLARSTDLGWRAPSGSDTAWFPGRVELLPGAPADPHAAEACADPRAEVVEALRWARRLLSDGVPASQVAIASAGSEAWDEHVLVLARDARLPIHFTHGLPALDTREGQACAALADLLLQGLSQERVRRLARRTSVSGLPVDWARGLRRAAGLYTLPEWRHALVAARPERASGAAAETILLPLLERLAKGPAAAAAAGEQLLEGAALQLWRQALRAAPAEALESALGGLRVPDRRAPGAAFTWGPAAHLAAAPRPYVRLIGLSSRGWPRADAEDALLPDHILPRRMLQPVSRIEQDLRAYEVIAAQASGGLTLSRPRRSSEGATLAPSRLWPAAEAVLARTRVPAHAFNEADRLLARPRDAAADPALALGRLCWRNWNVGRITVHDGVLPPRHPLVLRALDGAHAPTILRRLLRDPLGYVWRQALDWRPGTRKAPPLELDPATFGDLVHELLRRALDALEPHPGLARASADEREQAVEAAAAMIGQAWPTERPVPPPLLWRHTLARASRMARDGLAFPNDHVGAGARSWAELDIVGPDPAAAPWTQAADVRLGGLRISGRIDRLDLAEAEEMACVTDYKTGERPRGAHRLVLGGGTELQRVVYAAAARALRPELRQVVSRLVYLKDAPDEYPLGGEPLDAALADAARYAAIAADLLRSGVAHPGGDEARGAYYDARLALPADLDGYFRRKGAAFAAALTALTPLWGQP